MIDDTTSTFICIVLPAACVAIMACVGLLCWRDRRREKKAIRECAELERLYQLRRPVNS